jgi:hypothetical protein
VKWSPDLTQTIETLRTIRLQIDRQRIVKDVCYKLDGKHETTLELDSHANTCVLGCDALIILDYNRPVSIVGYDESLGSKTYQIVSGVVAYDDPQTRRTLHLVINQAIHIPHLDHHPLCPMQCRVNDVTVNDLPKFLATDPTDQMHALTLTDPNIPLQLVIFPLILRGATSVLNVRSVTINDFNSHDYLRLHLTSETLTWDPMTDLYEQQEHAMMDYSGNIVRDAAVRGPQLILNELQTLATDLADLVHDCNFYQVFDCTHCCVKRRLKPEWARVIAQICANRLYDLCRPVDDCPGLCKEDCATDYAAGCPHLLEPHSCTMIPNQ